MQNSGSLTYRSKVKLLVKTLDVAHGPALSKPNPHEFIGGFDLSAITCNHGDARKATAAGRRKQTPNAHFATDGSAFCPLRYGFLLNLRAPALVPAEAALERPRAAGKARISQVP